MKTLIFIIGLIFITVLPSYATDIIYDAGTVSKMVVEIEQCRNEQEQMEIQKGMIDSLNGQLSIREQEVNEGVEGFKKCMALMEKKDAICDARVKDAKPKLQQNLMWAGIGAVCITIIKYILAGVIL